MRPSGVLPQHDRRFRTLDAMVLLFAFASSFALIRATGVHFGSGYEDYEAGTISLTRFLVPKIAGFCVSVIAPILVGLSLAALILGRLAPRPSWRRWTRQPGVIGPIGAMTAITIDCLWYAAIWLADRRYSDTLLAASVGRWLDIGFVAIVASWLTLRLTGHWRRPRSWPDRMGIWIGIAWITSAGFARFVDVLWVAMR